MAKEGIDIAVIYGPEYDMWFDGIEHAYHELGIRSFWARPNFLNHRNLGDRYYDPIYELLQELDCAFATHEFMGLNAATEDSNRFRTFTEWHSTVHPHEAMNAMLSMVVNGVFERFPRLRCADVIRWFGDDHIVFESDFPHPDSKYPEATQEFFDLMPDEISMDSKRKILWGNAIDLYRFPESMMPTEFNEV